jgi:acetyl-CoA carboxylase biotin carboxyl carrier protein
MTRDRLADASNGTGAVRTPQPEPPADDAVLDGVGTTVLRLLSSVRRQPSSLKVAVGNVEVVLEWPAPEVAPSGRPEDGTRPEAVGAADAFSEPVAGMVVRAETVGVFYSAPQPGAAPFVAVGDQVTAGQQVGIVEAMKMMIPVNAAVSGRVESVMVADGTPVEYGEPLLVLIP